MSPAEERHVPVKLALVVPNGLHGGVQRPSALAGVDLFHLPFAFKELSREIRESRLTMVSTSSCDDNGGSSESLRYGRAVTKRSR